MGREIVYCEGCGHRLTEKDFDRGKAQDHDGRPFCGKCRPVTAPPPPRPEDRITDRRTKGATGVRRKMTDRIPFATPPPTPLPRPPAASHPWFAVGLGLVLGGILVVVAWLMTSKSEPPPEPAPMAAKPPPEQRPPPVDPVEQHLRALESFAATSNDPQAVLARCEQARAMVRGTVHEPRFLKIEARAKDAEIDRALAAIRKIILDDPTFARQAEVAKLLSALPQSGPRAPEIQKLQSEYRTLCEDDAKRREAAKKPPKGWMELFLDATKLIAANNYPGAKAVYLEGVPLLPATRPEDLGQRGLYAVGLYNLACIYSVEAATLAEKPRAQALDDAFKHLEAAMRGDYGRLKCACHPQTLGIGHMAEDKDLIAVRADARYTALMKKYK